MLLSAVIEISPLKQCVLPTSTGNYIHGLFFNLLRACDADLAIKLHEDNRAKPFTVSPLHGNFSPVARGHNGLDPDKKYWFRFTSLNEELSSKLMTFLSGSRGKTCVIGDNEMIIQDVILDSAGHSWAGSSAHKRLYDKYIIRQEGICKNITISFFTPTTFKQEDNYLLLPIPRILFHTTLEKWDTLSGISIDRKDFLSWLEENCMVSRYELKTRMWNFDKYKYAGFVGEVEFTDTSKSDSFYRALWNLLADYIFWSGVGAKTTMGMGIARRL